MTAYSKAVYKTLDKIIRSNVSKSVYYSLYMLQRIYATFAKYIGLAEYGKHEKTQDTVRVLVRIPRTLIGVKGDAWPYQELELLLTWQYYLFGCTFYFDHQLILSLFIMIS